MAASSKAFPGNTSQRQDRPQKRERLVCTCCYRQGLPPKECASLGFILMLRLFFKRFYYSTKQSRPFPSVSSCIESADPLESTTSGRIVGNPLIF
eukprot:Gb_00018 [translate_table: standard]